MKPLKSYITESKTNIVVAFEHSSPHHTHIILNDTKKDVRETRQYEYFEASPKTNIVCIRHNDESCSIVDVANNEAAMKRDTLKLLKASVEKLENEGWDEPVIPMFGTYFLMEEGDNWNPGETENDIYNKLEEIIKDSEVDGDSTDVIILADLSKSNVILSGSNDVSFHSVEEWNNKFKE